MQLGQIEPCRAVPHTPQVGTSTSSRAGLSWSSVAIACWSACELSSSTWLAATRRAETFSVCWAPYWGARFWSSSSSITMRRAAPFRTWRVSKRLHVLHRVTGWLSAVNRREPRSECSWSFRATQKVALDQVSTELAEQVQRGLVFDTFGDDQHPQTVAKPDRRRDDRLVARVRDQVAHERLVDLQLADRQTFEIRQ